MNTNLRNAGLISLIVTFPLFSETILLRNGESLKGKVINQNYSKIFLESKNKNESGEPIILEISKSNVLKVVYKEIDEEEVARLRKMEDDKLKSSESNEDLKKNEETLAEKQKAEEEEKRKNEEMARKRAEWESNNITPFGAFGRSAILPGWGQYENNRKTTGIIYGTLFFTSVFALYNKNRQYLNAKKDYDNIGNPYAEAQYITNFYGASTPSVTQADLLNPVNAYLYQQTNPTIQKREEVEKRYNEVKKLSYLVAGIYIINLVDAFFRHEQRSFSGMNNGFFMDYSISRSNSIGYLPNASSLIDQQYTFGYNLEFGGKN